MDTSSVKSLSPAEREQFAAMTERMRQFRRRNGVPDGVTVAEAVALHMIRAEDLAHARWGDSGPPAPAVATREESHGIS
jgi:hypothetical protein